MGTTNSGVRIPPNPLDIQMILLERPRSEGGIQREMTEAVEGNAPASPAPKRNRTISIDRSPVTRPVAKVNVLHQSTIRVITRRGPIRSESMPEGISNAA